MKGIKKMLDLKFYEEENKMLRQMMLHWKEMYENLYTSHKQLLKSYDDLVVKVMKHDLEEINEKQICR